MRIITRHFIILLSGLLILSSCVPNRRIVLLQEKTKVPSTMSTQASAPEEQYIRPSDELYIRINSMDDYTEYYNITTAGGGMYGRMDPSLSSYTVEINGTIFLPMIGNIYVEGFTLEEAGKKIQEMYKGYLNQPAVNVRFVDKVVTVLGEVDHPGVYTFTKREIPIFEALAYAGDMTIYANRNKILIIRERENVIYRHRIDITSPDVQASKYYNIQPNDVVYVEPLKRRIWGYTEIPFGLIFSMLSSTIIILGYIYRP